MTLVAISASFGAGGSRIGPALAERLGVPFLDRAIPLRVAAELDVEPQVAEARDWQPGPRRIEQLLRGFIGSDTGVPVPVPPESFTTQDFRRATEEVLRRQAATGEGVILGRAAVVVLREDPWVLRVRLDGPVERRIEHAVSLDPTLDPAAAERAARRTDRTHAEYARQLYGVDIGDPALYHLVVDSASLGVGTSVGLIAAAIAALPLSSRPPD